MDDHNNIFVSDRSNKKITIISSSGEVYIIAGSGDYGELNGSGDNASFGFTANIILNQNNDILLADEKNNVIRKISYTLSDSNDNHSYQEIFEATLSTPSPKEPTPTILDLLLFLMIVN